MIIVVLMIRPLAFSANATSRGLTTMRSGDFKETYSELSHSRIHRRSGCVLVLIVALIRRPTAELLRIVFLTIILITVVGALGLNILTGYTA